MTRQPTLITEPTSQPHLHAHVLWMTGKPQGRVPVLELRGPRIGFTPHNGCRDQIAICGDRRPRWHCPHIHARSRPLLVQRARGVPQRASHCVCVAALGMHAFSARTPCVYACDCCVVATADNNAQFTRGWLNAHTNYAAVHERSEPGSWQHYLTRDPDYLDHVKRPSDGAWPAAVRTECTRVANL